MYEYKYEEASLGGFFTSANYREIIDKYAKKGWRLVQVLATEYTGHGKPTKYEIIFERSIDSDKY